MNRFRLIKYIGTTLYKINSNCNLSTQSKFCSLITCSRNFSFILDNLQRHEFKGHCINIQRFKGHSKWQNIASTKKAKDSLKSVKYSRICKSVRKAVLEGGADLKLNTRLAGLWEQSRAINMPAATFNRAVERALNIQLKAVTLEIMGPGGCLMVVEGEGETKGKFTNWLRRILRKANCPFMIVENRIKQNFIVKGLIVVNGHEDNKPLDLDAATDVAVEAGAEEVEQNEETSEITFITEPEQLPSVRTQVEKYRYKVDMAEVVYTPIATVTLTGEDLEAVKRFLSMVEEEEDVFKTHHNVEGDLES